MLTKFPFPFAFLALLSLGLTVSYAQPKVNVTANPNFIIIVPDDHRWDATSYMQSRILSDFGRVARYPYLVDDGDPTTTDPHTPNMDSLASDGLYFDNGFVVYSLCSPSRATMLTGVQPFVHGITANDDEFPVDSVTYATILRDSGWSTGYFGKWHMGTQVERPGFDHIRTFYGRGSYFGAKFYDENKQLVQTAGARDPGGDDYDQWVDKISTDYLLDFIDSKYAADERFVAFIGFKTPHDKRFEGNLSNAPSSPTPALNFSALFSDDSNIPVPSLLSQNGAAPVWKPDASVSGDGNNTRAYMQMIAAIDAQVGRILDKLDALTLTNNTVVIYISDNGYFRGEHGLGDKRAGYEESLRVPFMIRYPDIQPSGAGLTPTTKIGLNLDLAPTILDIAGQAIPDHMQGHGLKPLLEGTTPPDWRDAFVFSYTEDPEFAEVDPADMVGIRTEDGYKLIRYAENSGWDELFHVDASATDDEKYENTNLISEPSEATILADLERRLGAQLSDVGMIRVLAPKTYRLPFEVEFLAGDRYPFVVEKSTDLESWTITAEFEGGGEATTIDLVGDVPTSWDIAVTGDTADYTIRYNPLTDTTDILQVSDSVLRMGSKVETGRNDGRDAVLVFELPVLPVNTRLSMAQLAIYGSRQFAKCDVDLWAIGIKGNTTPILDYHASLPQNGTKLQDRFMDHNTPALPEFSWVESSLAGGLSAYLRNFYENQPTYAGGQYLFLRLNPAIEPRDQPTQGNDDRNFRVTAANDATNPPILYLSHTEPRITEKEFFRVRYGIQPSAPIN